MPLQLFNTRTRRVEVFASAEGRAKTRIPRVAKIALYPASNRFSSRLYQ